MDTIRTLEELLVSLQDHQSIKQPEGGKKEFETGYAEGLETAICLIQAAIRDEEKAEKEGI